MYQHFDRQPTGNVNILCASKIPRNMFNIKKVLLQWWTMEYDGIEVNHPAEIWSQQQDMHVVLDHVKSIRSQFIMGKETTN